MLKDQGSVSGTTQQVWWCTPVIPVLGRWRQEDQIHGELVASLSQTKSMVLKPVRWLSA